MLFRKALITVVTVLFSLTIGLIDSASAADRDFSRKAKPSYSVNTGSSSHHIDFRSKIDRSSSRSISSHDKKPEDKLYGSRILPVRSNFIEAILDYDDYTHIFRAFENKE